MVKKLIFKDSGTEQLRKKRKNVNFKDSGSEQLVEDLGPEQLGKKKKCNFLGFGPRTAVEKRKKKCNI